MRTTIDLDEDILQVAKHLAQERAQSLGKVCQVSPVKDCSRHLDQKFARA